jgi:hypothetical protein
MTKRLDEQIQVEYKKAEAAIKKYNEIVNKQKEGMFKMQN